jgi:hypothetical protein
VAVPGRSSSPNTEPCGWEPGASAETAFAVAGSFAKLGASGDASARWVQGRQVFLFSLGAADKSTYLTRSTSLPSSL